MNAVNIGRRTLFGLLGLCLAAAAGCEGGASQGEVHGLVRLDGKPVEHGTIEFVAQDGQAPTAGKEISDGRYTVRVPVGTTIVRIRASWSVGQHRMTDDPNGPIINDWQSIIPIRYNDKSELRVEVGPGSREENFDLVGEK